MPTVAVGEVVEEIVAVFGPPNNVHVPEPLVGMFPFNLIVSCKQTILSAPALAGVTAGITVIIVDEL